MALLGDTWSVEFHSGIPVYRQIIHHVQAAVAAGRLAEGDQLPTIRALHEKLGVNPNTVVRAYRELQHLGVITMEQGSGCFVASAPAARAMTLSSKQKQAKLQDLCTRFTAEARGHGISFAELVQQLQRQRPA